MPSHWPDSSHIGSKRVNGVLVLFRINIIRSLAITRRRIKKALSHIEKGVKYMLRYRNLPTTYKITKYKVCNGKHIIYSIVYKVA